MCRAGEVINSTEPSEPEATGLAELSDSEREAVLLEQLRMAYEELERLGAEQVYNILYYILYLGNGSGLIMG